MNTNLTIALAAAVSLLFATGAFAASEDYPAPLTHEPTVSVQALVNTQSSEAYPTFSSALSTPSLAGTDVAENNGSESSVQSPNSLPARFEVGTEAYNDQQIQNRWFAQQAQHRFALRQVAQPRG